MIAGRFTVYRVARFPWRQMSAASVCSDTGDCIAIKHGRVLPQSAPVSMVLRATDAGQRRGEGGLICRQGLARPITPLFESLVEGGERASTSCCVSNVELHVHMPGLGRSGRWVPRRCTSYVHAYTSMQVGVPNGLGNVPPDVDSWEWWRKRRCTKRRDGGPLGFLRHHALAIPWYLKVGTVAREEAVCEVRA